MYLGFTMIAGSLFIYQEFHEKPVAEKQSALAGFTLMALAGVGTFFVGIFPENAHHALHLVSASLAIGVGNLAILILGWTLDIPQRLKSFMRFWAPVSLIAGCLLAFHHNFGIGAGLMERIAAYPESIWLIIFGAYIGQPQLKGHKLMLRMMSFGTHRSATQ